MDQQQNGRPSRRAILAGAAGGVGAVVAATFAAAAPALAGTLVPVYLGQVNTGLKNTNSGIGVAGIVYDDHADAAALDGRGTGKAIGARLQSDSGFALVVIGARVDLGPVAGVVSLPSGATSVTVDPGVGIGSGSFVLLTPQGDPGARRLWVTMLRAADTFRVRTTVAANHPLEVAWLLLG